MSKRTIGVIGVIISAVFFGFVPTFSTYLTSVGGTTLRTQDMLAKLKIRFNK